MEVAARPAPHLEAGVAMREGEFQIAAQFKLAGGDAQVTVGSLTAFADPDSRVQLGRDSAGGIHHHAGVELVGKEMAVVRGDDEALRA